MKTLVIISSGATRLSISTHLGMTIEDFTSEALDEIHGTGRWVAYFEDELPSDFSVETYAIENGSLVLASEETIAERNALSKEAENKAIEAQRRARYDDPNGTCAPLYWKWQESQTPADYDAWVAAKATVRQKLPYQV